MGTIGRVITSAIILLSIVGLIFVSESTKVNKPEFTTHVADTPYAVKGKKFNSLEDAIDAFLRAYAKEFGIDGYESMYESNKKFEQQGEIPVIMKYTMEDEESGKEQLKITPFYVKNQNGKFTAVSYNASGRVERLPHSRKYVVFSQNLGDRYYDFVVAKELKDLPESDAVFNFIQEKFYIGVKAFDSSEILKDDE